MTLSHSGCPNAVKTFNRTSLELKSGSVLYVGSAALTFNRTSLELKSRCTEDAALKTEKDAFNRTSLELKSGFMKAIAEIAVRLW